MEIESYAALFKPFDAHQWTFRRGWESRRAIIAMQMNTKKRKRIKKWHEQRALENFREWDWQCHRKARGLSHEKEKFLRRAVAHHNAMCEMMYNFHLMIMMEIKDGQNG